MPALHVFRPEDPGDGPHIRGLVEAFLADKISELKPHTYADRQRVCTLFADGFAERQYDEIFPSEVKSWILAQSRWRGDTTRWNVLCVLKSFFNWCVRDRRINFNPIAGLVLKKGPPRRSDTEREFQDLLRSTDASMRRVLIFLRATGCRPQDSRSLEWEWINWRDGVAVIPPGEHKGGSRTGKPKVLVLTAVATNLLLWLQRRGPAGKKVFLNSRGQAWTRAAYSQRLTIMRGIARLPKEVSLHGIRHLFGSSGVSRGGNVKLISEALGHSNVRTTEDFYLHLRDHNLEAVRKAAELAAKRPNRID